MKISLLFLFFMVSQPIWAQNQERDDDPATGDRTEFPETPLPPQRPSEFHITLYQDYDSLEDLEEWAYNTSRFGGRIKTIEVSGREIYYSVRTFTGAHTTCEIIFFALDHRGKISPFLAIPLKHREMKVKVEGTQIVVAAFIESKLTPILSFTPDMLPRLPQ